MLSDLATLFEKSNTQYQPVRIKSCILNTDKTAQKRAEKRNNLYHSQVPLCVNNIIFLTLIPSIIFAVKMVSFMHVKKCPVIRYIEIKIIGVTCQNVLCKQIHLFLELCQLSIASCFICKVCNFPPFKTVFVIHFRVSGTVVVIFNCFIQPLQFCQGL